MQLQITWKHTQSNAKANITIVRTEKFGGACKRFVLLSFPPGFQFVAIYNNSSTTKSKQKAKKSISKFLTAFGDTFTCGTIYLWTYNIPECVPAQFAV